ncbi:MAG TPA: hypothetical protein VIH71_04955 [Solirubrobacteraceae bacterium]
MRSAIAAILAVVAGLALANMIGVASAEAPTTATTPVRTVSVDGVASLPIAQGANMAVARSIYREGMAAAVADGQNKAEFLASKTAATLGNVQSVTEGSGSIQCTGGEEAAYVEYDGEQPDFGSSVSRVIAPEVAGAAPVLHKPAAKRPKKKRKRKPSAKAATATTCTLSTDVTLVYAIS